MSNSLLIAVAAVSLALSSPVLAQASCETGHWVEEVVGDGNVVVLEDGSVWRIDPLDVIDAMLWLPTDDVIVCDDFLIHVDDGEKVRATQIR